MQYWAARLKAGFVGMAGSADGLRRLTLPRSTAEEALAELARDLPDGAFCKRRAFASLEERLVRYLSGDAVDFSDVALDLEGRTAFQQQVLLAVRAIPRGHVRSYRQVAAGVGRPGAARAVGAVMAANPVCIIVPCHRVIASDGTVGGFGGGSEMKRRLLAMEGVSLSFSPPSRGRVRVGGKRGMKPSFSV